MANFQTLSEFIASPFGSEKPMVDATLDNMMLGMRLRIEGFTVLEKSYYIHIKIPSTSNDGKTVYDVIIRFFPQNKQMEKELSLQNYWIQFFSNSPSFMYKYAVLYKNHGYLIEELYDKMDPKYLDTLPEKTNKDMELSYDKSLYLACKYLASHKFKLLTKLGVLTQHKKDPVKFFKDVSSFQAIKLDQDLIAMERRVSRQLDSEKSRASSKPSNKMAGNRSNTYRSGTKTIHKKVPGHSTASITVSSFHKAAKKTAKRTTKK